MVSKLTAASFLVVGERSGVVELFPCEDESLLFGRDSLLVLDLSLDIGDCHRLTRLGVDSERSAEGFIT